MKCPNCGYELPEGHLLCEKCGAEIKIVPDFDIEMENSISETMSGIFDEVNHRFDNSSPTQEIIVNIGHKSKEEEFEEEFFKERKPISFPKTNLSKKMIAIVFLAIVLVVSSIVIGGLSIYWNNSVNYQKRQADYYLHKGQYKKALEYIEKGIAISSDDLDLLYEKANILFGAGDDEEALALCMDCINNKNMDIDHEINMYQLIISNYESDSDYNSINELLLTAPKREVKETFKNYLAEPPEFSVPTGNYEAKTTLSLSGCGDGNIYYTLDGFTPTKDHGNLYNGSILLEKGEYNINAVYINQFGISSEVSSSYYLIDVEVPQPPVVIPESGSYTSAFSIIATSLEEGDEIYYTLDGKEPDKETGILYEGPVNPPVGKSNLAFICVNKDGIYSESVKRSYDFDLVTNMSKEDTVVYLLNDLFLAGKIQDRSGKSNDGKGTYSYSFNSLVEISGLGYYYSLDEFYTDNSGKKQRTAFTYAVNPYTGEGFYLISDNLGNMGLVPLG